MWIQVMQSPLGELSAYWSSLGISRLLFGRSSDELHQAVGEKPASTFGAHALASAMHEYFQGGPLDFPLGYIDWTGTPEFHRRVLEACTMVVRGQTRTYGQLAIVAGSPGAARAVGQAMARNRWPLIIPCHRVVGQSGQMTGYSGAGGVDTKRALLDFEAGRKLMPSISRQTASQLGVLGK